MIASNFILNNLQFAIVYLNVIDNITIKALKLRY